MDKHVSKEVVSVTHCCHGTCSAKFFQRPTLSVSLLGVFEFFRQENDFFSGDNYAVQQIGIQTAPDANCKQGKCGMLH